MKGMGILAASLAVALLCGGCCDFRSKKDRKLDKVLVVYQAGCNSLSGDLLGDINELRQGSLPSLKDRQAIVIVGHHPTSYGVYGVKTRPCIIRLYKDAKGTPVLDTLTQLGIDDLLTKKEVMARALNYVAETFPSEHYGMIMSSHGTGWLPPDYYNNPDKYKAASSSPGLKSAPRIVFPTGPVPYTEPEPMPGPRTRTYGEEIVNEGGVRTSLEMGIADLAAAIPFRFDYILMDVCLMGCVEVAYELKDKCRYLGFSPTEILAAGLDYTKVADRLLKSGDPDIKGAMDDFYECYDAQRGDYKSASFTLVDCSKLEALAAACKKAFAAGREAIATVNPSKVQPFFRSYHHWFYDLQDILDQAGADSREVQSALKDCIAYSIHTAAFMPNYGGFTFRTYCGLSMYLPCNGSAYLDAYYKTLAWNKATSLVQ